MCVWVGGGGGGGGERERCVCERVREHVFVLSRYIHTENHATMISQYPKQFKQLENEFNKTKTIKL